MTQYLAGNISGIKQEVAICMYALLLVLLEADSMKLGSDLVHCLPKLNIDWLLTKMTVFLFMY